MARRIFSWMVWKNSALFSDETPILGRLMVTTPMDPVSGLAPNKPPPRFRQFTVVKAQSAAHGSCIFRRHVRIDEIGEIGDAVFTGHFPYHVQIGIVPVKVFGNVIRRYGEGKDPSFGVAFHHDLCKSHIQDVHLRLESPHR